MNIKSLSMLAMLLLLSRPGEAIRLRVADEEALVESGDEAIKVQNIYGIPSE